MKANYTLRTIVKNSVYNTAKRIFKKSGNRLIDISDANIVINGKHVILFDFWEKNDDYDGICLVTKNYLEASIDDCIYSDTMTNDDFCAIYNALKKVK